MEAKDVGARIKYFRELKGLCRNELANLAGVSPTYIYQLEQGLKSPTVTYLEFICFGLGITLERFFTDGKKDGDEIACLSPEQKKHLETFLKSMKS